jgi:cysteine synthase
MALNLKNQTGWRDREFGLLVSTSSGVNAAAALGVARDLSDAATLVPLLFDRAERYFGAPLLAESGVL